MTGCRLDLIFGQLQKNTEMLDIGAFFLPTVNLTPQLKQKIIMCDSVASCGFQPNYLQTSLIKPPVSPEENPNFSI